ncbi:hypothetical protein [Nostoc sp.]
MQWRNRPPEAIAFAVFGVTVDESAIASFLKAQRQQLISYFISCIC